MQMTPMRSVRPLLLLLPLLFLLSCLPGHEGRGPRLLVPVSERQDKSGGFPEREEEDDTLARRLPAQTLLPKHRLEDVHSVERNAVLMGTDVSILILTQEREVAEQAIDLALGEIRRIEQSMSEWREGSRIAEINRNAGVGPVEVDHELMELLLEAKEISRLTDGCFDVTFAAVGKLWGFGGGVRSLPDPKDIEKARTLVNYRLLEIDKDKGTVFLVRKGMRIGLGGIAKGYAVDLAAARIRESGFRNFAVNAGGDLTVRGRINNDLWWVGIAHPRSPEKNFAILPVSNATVVTSGDSMRFFIHNGKRYHHIIDPATGYPADRCQSVTIVSRKASWADALATGVFVMGPDRGMNLIESLEHVEGVIVDAQGKVHVSTGLQKGASFH